MAIINKYIFVNQEEYQYEISQSKKDGTWFCDKIRATGSTRKEAKQKLIDSANDVITVMNTLNKTAKAQKNMVGEPKNSPTTSPNNRVRM